MADMPVNKIALITCIGNESWHGGPGHSALVIEKEIWSFEGSGWTNYKPSNYVAINAFRTMVIQELNHNVPSAKALEYCKSTKKAGAGYLTSGVCSSHAGDAIAHAYGQKLNANLGSFDFPDDLALLVEKKKLVTNAYIVLAKKESDKQKSMRAEDFSHLKSLTPPSFLSW